MTPIGDTPSITSGTSGNNGSNIVVNNEYNLSAMSDKGVLDIVTKAATETTEQLLANMPSGQVSN